MSFSKGNKTPNGEQSQVWYKGKIGFIASVTLITVVIVSFLVGASLRLHEPLGSDDANNTPTGNIDWTCSLASHNETFIVTVDVNLADGMNRDEAVKVATEVFNVTIGHGLHQFRSANEDEKGIWTIELTWGYSIQDLGHWFEVVIDSFNQTVVYDRCK